MGDVVNMRSCLTMNSRFIGEFISAPSPCFALGLVEEFGREHGFLALRPGEYIPDNVTDMGFRLGHVLVGTECFEVVQFMFEFYGFRTYNTLLNPNNPIVQTVLKTIVKEGDCFIFALGVNQSVTAFRNPLEEGDPYGLKANLPRILRSKTTEAQFQRVVLQFERKPDPPGKLLHWVCRDDESYLDLSKDRLELRPS